jgi:DUF4097 and DUF4098 domain-containing protein YvlB
MPTFQTPQPIAVTVDISVGRTEIVASDRSDAVVEVTPRDPGNANDVRAVNQTKVDFSGGALVVRSGKTRTLFNKVGGVDVKIELPTGSTVRGTMAVGELLCDGEFGDCTLKIAAGDIRVDTASAVNVKTSSGDVSVQRVSGDADLTGGGGLRVGYIGGSATLKNTNGDTWVGECAGDLKIKSANGGITVDRALADVEAKTANGSVRVGEVSQGEVSLETSAGSVEVGIAEGSAAWLDVSSVVGAVRNTMQGADSPAATDRKVRVRAHTVTGDVVVRRAEVRA